MEKLLEGKTGIITGGATGIGRASALLFAREGAKIVIADINEKESEETVRLVKDIGGEILFFKCDVRDEEQVKAMVHFTVSRLGPLKWALNNAGVVSQNAPLADSSTEDWEFVLRTNVFGYYFCMKYEIPEMLKTGGGAIVNTGSNAGVVSTANGAAYGTSKFAVTGMTQCAALDYAKKNIRINSIGPGATDTPLMRALIDKRPEIMDPIISGIPDAHFGLPEEQANAALFLLSDRAFHITATHLLVDGGQFALM
jgi:NAD(P)-dependent dehydrogenase (short-subunit alcohol dehydrogenase family)